MPFTPAQDAAIHAHNRELLVSAAAGSGKTRVLIERIFYMLRDDGLSMDRMLIVTFTRAAAAEMRERLQTRLAEAALTDSRMRRQAELLETAQISTLHSFCQKLVREYFQEVDIDPQAMLGDETICANLRAQAISDAMEAIYEQAASGEDTARALTQKFEDATIERMLDSLLRFLMSLPDPFAWLDACAAKEYTADDLARGEMADTIFADCMVTLSGAEELCRRNLALAQRAECPQPYIASIRADENALRAITDAAGEGLTALMAETSRFSLGRMPSLKKLEGVEAEIRDQYKQNRDLLKKRITSLSTVLPEDADTAIRRLNAMQPALRGLARLARDTDERYATAKRERALLDFNDLERMALRILRNPAIREEVSARFDGVFVDEYQDISGVQEAILNALKRNVSRETSGKAQHYFYVGDVKQSIYRFRQADPTLFMEKARNFLPDEEAPQRRVSLNANFRSRETVLATVNRVFERVMRADVTEIAYDAEARLYPGAVSALDPSTSLHLFSQVAKPADRIRLQAYAIGREIRRRVGEPFYNRAGIVEGTLHYRDFAILGPKMKGVADVLERTLGEMGIPVYSEERGGGMESEEIAQALNHLRLMDNIADDLALIASLRSPAVGMDDRELAMIRLRGGQGSFLAAMRAVAAGRDPLALRCADALAALERERFLLTESRLDEYLWGWLGRSGLYAFYGCQQNGKLRQANLRMLCDRAGEHVKRRGGDLHDFLAGTQADTSIHDSKSPTVLSPWEDVVRVMTIHKSKGLEFPVVFVMGLEEGFGGRSDSRAAMHPRLGVALPYVNEEARTTGDTILKGAIDLRSQAEERAERARLLYVAMTRAREELILMGWSNLLTPEDAADGFAQNAEASAYSVASAKNMLAWVCQCVNGLDTVEVLGDEPVSDNGVRTIDAGEEFSTQSTNNPHKNGFWRVVFHNGEAELQAALHYAKGGKEWTELESRKARLRALAENARALAEKNAVEVRAALDSGMPTHSAGDAVPGSCQAEGSGNTSDRTRVPDSRWFASIQSPPGGTGAGLQNAGEAAALQHGDPLLPRLSFPHRPFKVGVTALVRAEQPFLCVQPVLTDVTQGDTGALETLDQKRLPLPLARPKLMNDLPTMPGFLRPPPEQTGLRRGIATHRSLSLMDFAGLRAAMDTVDGLRAEVKRQLETMCSRRLMEAEECASVNADTVATFFLSPCGQQALVADTVRREWSFNLRLPEWEGLIAQGVIDLCYLWEGEWLLVDYKTDSVAQADALWLLYGRQIALYRRALEEATGIPVRQATLFSLSLGVGSSRP